LPKIDAGLTPAQPWDAPLVGCVAALASGGAKDFFQFAFKKLTTPLPAPRGAPYAKSQIETRLGLALPP